MHEKSFSRDLWSFYYYKDHILKSEGDEIRKVEDYLKIPMLPEMLFDKNHIVIKFNGSSAATNADQTSQNPAEVSAKKYTFQPFLIFDSISALEKIAYLEKPLQVALSKEWQEANSEIIEQNTTHTNQNNNKREDSSTNSDSDAAIPPQFDWTFSTPHAGELFGNWTVTRDPPHHKIDNVLLSRRDPILFSTELDLFEDELGDSGISSLAVRLRVMPGCFLLLQRFFLRVDGTQLRCWDTRVYGRLDEAWLLREVTHRESSAWRGEQFPEMAKANPLNVTDWCDLETYRSLELLTPRQA